MTIFFGLGSNLGDRLQNLRNALIKLSTLGKIEGVSNVYQTSPWGGVPQPDYLNACAKLQTPLLSPLQLLKTVKSFEAELGRVPSVRWGERLIDIDILLIDDMVYYSPELDIPHVRIPERLFVLVPLNDIVSEDWRHPVNGKSISEMIADLHGEDMPVLFSGNLR